MRINVISLDRTPQRLVEFLKINQHLKDVSVFKAIDGLTLSEQDLIARGLIAKPTRYTKGALGCLMSHAALWNSTAATGEITTVCEDDAIFNLNFEHRAFDLLTMLPDDTDLIYWGWNFDAQTAIELIPGMWPCVAGFGKNPLPEDIVVFQNCPIVPATYRLLRAFGTTCYTITPKGAERLRKFCLPAGNEIFEFPEINVRIPNVGVDVGICNALPKIKGFCSFPPLVMSLNDPNSSEVRPSRLASA